MVLLSLLEFDYINHACLDMLSSWRTQHELIGGSLTIEWEELSSRFHMKRTGAQQEGSRTVT
jgi:hypothetical protein